MTASHTYASLGFKNVKVHIVDDGGRTADAMDQVLLYAPSSFVVGDATVGAVDPGLVSNGAAVTFWGGQWWRDNLLSGGTAPAAFKGYIDKPGALTNGEAWSTDPGNSSAPPASVPAYMSVVVSSSITQSGSSISGNIVHVVVVSTKSGYEGNPGHAGTGTVVWDIS